MSFQLIANERFNQDFRGHAEKCVYTFTVNLPDQLGAGWTARQSLEAHIAELQNQGSILLEYRLYEDKLSGTFSTDYKVELVASASPLWWNLIIIGVLASLSLFAIAWSIQSIKDIAQYSPGLAAGISLGVVAVSILIGAWLFREFR